MRFWLTDNMSLTQKLMAHSTHFRVARLQQERARCLADECTMIALPRRACVQQREVMLYCDGRPVVYAHTVMPLTATASDWPFFRSLGERALGISLFGDPRVEQGNLQYARLHIEHPLMRRARAALANESLAAPLFARRCLYRRGNGVLLVTELFLPAISQLEPRNPHTSDAGLNEPNR